jgi:hypothetical protein
VQVVSLARQTGTPADLVGSVAVLPDDAGELGVVVAVAAPQRLGVTLLAEAVAVLPDRLQEPVAGVRGALRPPHEDPANTG